MEKENIIESTHDDFLKLLVPLVEYMNANGFSYFLVAGKEEVCSRYIGGKAEDITGMLEALFIKHNIVKKVVEAIINQLNKS